MKVYRIRDKNGLYSTGGMSPDFTKGGKTWNNIGHVKSHLRQFFDHRLYRGSSAEIYQDAEIVSIEIKESEAETQSVQDVIIDMLEKDVIDMQKLSDNYPQSKYYAEEVLKLKEKLTLLKARKDETR